MAHRIAAGAAWLIAARLATRAIDFVGLLILANLLVPADFGLIAVAMTVVQIVEAVFELPVNQVLLRSDAVTRALLDTAFTIGLLRGVSLAAVIGITAEPFARFYHDPRLAVLLCVLSAAPVARSLLSPAMTRFAKVIDFRRDLMIELLGKSAALSCSVAFALSTRSYWALAIGTVVNPTVMMLASYGFAPHRPRLSLKHWPDFAHYVGWSTAAQLVSALNWQADRLLLGRIVSRADLGAYVLAGEIAAVPEQALLKPIDRPLLAAFSTMKRDPHRLVAAYLQTVHSVLAVGVPVMLGLSLLAEPAIRLALSAKWHASAPMLQWLALTLIPPLLTAPLGALSATLGRTDIFLKRNLIELAVGLPSVIVCAWLYGIAGVIAARLAIALVMALVTMLFVRRLLHVSVARQLAGPWRAMVAAAGLTLVLLVMRDRLHGLAGVPLAAGLSACAGSALAVYGAILLLLWTWIGRPKGIETMLATWATAAWSRRQTRNPA